MGFYLWLEDSMSFEEVKLQFKKEELRKNNLEKERKRKAKNEVIKSLCTLLYEKILEQNIDCLERPCLE